MVVKEGVDDETVRDDRLQASKHTLVVQVMNERREGRSKRG